MPYDYMNMVNFHTGGLTKLTQIGLYPGFASDGLMPSESKASAAAIQGEPKVLDGQETPRKRSSVAKAKLLQARMWPHHHHLLATLPEDRNAASI